MENRYRRTVLPNGLRVLTETIPYVRSVSLGIWVGTGSRHEPATMGGVSHFIEHLLFKGTARRTARQIAEEVDAVGGQLNAVTAKEYTCYYCRLLDEHLQLGMDVLGDMLLRSLFDPADVDRERGVILEEIRLYQDTPDELVHDLAAETLFGGHALGRPILGSVDAVSSVDREDVLDYFRRHYAAPNMVVAAAGNLEHERVVDLAVALGLDAEGKPHRLESEPPDYGPAICIRRKNTEQVHLCLATESVPLSHPDYHVVQLLSVVLGGGSSSRLFQEVRENRGLVYSIYSYQAGYRDAGMFAIYAGMSPLFTSEVLRVIREEFAKLRTGRLDKDELDRARQQIKGSLMLGMESTSNRMTHMGRSQLLRGEVPTPDEIIARIEAVKLEDVLRVARRMLCEERVALSAVGPIGEEEVEPLWRG